MTYEEWKKKREESTSDSQSKNSDYNNWLLKSGKLNSVGEEISNRVNAWLQNNNDFLANHNNRIGNNQGKDILDWTYVSDSADWRSTVAKQHLNFKAESNNIKSLLNQYKDYFSEDYVNSVIDALDGNLEVQGGVLASATEQDKFWSEFETEDAYKSWVAGQRELNAQLSYDLVEGKAEIDRLQNIVDSFGNLNLYAHGSDTASTPRSGAEVYNEQAKAFAQKYGISYEDAKRQLSEKKAYYTLAERVQKAAELASVSDINSENYDPEFEKYAQIGADIKNPTAMEAESGVYIFGHRVGGDAEVGNIVTYSRENAEEMAFGELNGGGSSVGGRSIYARMKDDEVKIYNYYLAKYGKDKANEYLESIEETLQARHGEQIFEALEGKPELEYLFGVAAGLDQFASGLNGWFSDGYTPTSATQYASGKVREDLEGKGIPVWYNFKEGKWENEILGSSTSQIFYDSITTTSNMLPSILASTASNLLVPGSGAFVGAGLMGASAGGSAKAEMLNLGYSEAQANTYGAMVAVAEGSMEYLLGGITKLGGKLPDGIVGKILTKVDNALARTAIKIGGSMLSEGFEEGLQTVIEPWLKELATGVDWEDPSIDEVLYSSLLGALSAFGLEGAGVVAGEVGTYQAGKAIRNTSGGVGMLRDIAMNTNYFSADSVAHKIASKVDAFTGAYTIGRLLNEVGGTISEQNLTDIVNGLTERGIRESDARVIAKQYQAFLNGEMSLTDEQVKVFENLSPLADVLRKNIIGANTTVYQRTRAYADLMTLAEETANKKKSKTTESKLDSTKPTEASTESVTPEEKANYVSEVERIASEVAGSIPTKTGRFLQEQVNSANETAADRLGVEGKYTSTETGATRLASSGKDVNIVKVESIKDGVMKVKLNDGSIVSAEEIDFSTSDEALVYEAVTNMGVSPTTAWEIIKAYDPKRDISGTIYAMGALEAYTYGHNGVKIEGMSQEGFAALLSPVQKNTAHRLGSIDAMAKVEAQQKTIDKARDRVRNNAKILHKPVAKRKGGVVLEGIKSTSLTNHQESQIEVLGKIAEGLGVTFHIFKSDDNFKYTMPDGTVRSANGWYNPKTGEIWIDLNSGEVGQSTIIFTAAHELTHFIKHWSPAKFKVFADFLFEQYGKQGETLEQLIRDRMESLKAHGRTNGMSLTEIYDLAYEEIVADSTQAFLRDSNAAEKIAALREKDANLANKIKSFLGQMLAKMRKVLADAKILPESKESQIVAEMTDSIQKLYDLWTDALADAGRAYSMLGGEIDLDGDSNSHIMSDRTMVEGAGLQFVIEEDGIHYKVLDADGNAVKSVTPEAIANSPLGQLVASAKESGFLGEGREAELAAKKQYKFLAELVNMCIKYDGLAPVWEVAGTMVFSSIKSNADKQYGLTIDFSTVCKKTQAIVDAMSEAMVRLGRGLTRSEVETIYLEVGKAGESTPCPVCYVFSRWMGIGGILDQMSRFQDKYINMSDAELQTFIADIKRRIVERANTPGKDGTLKKAFFDKNGEIKEGQVIADLKQKANSGAGSALKAISKNSDTLLEIQQLQELMKRQDAKEAKKTATKIKKLEAKLVDVATLEKQFKEFNDIVEEYEAYQWLTRTLMKEVNGEWIRNTEFKPVPKDVLFDLNKGATFAEDYPLSWAFRTGKGASAGKAITPYADARVGEAIQGIAAQDVKDIKTGLDLNPFLNGDTKTRERIIASAIEKQARQNLIGGQRYQSTSDFRYEYGSDYLITFLEMQAVGAKVQLYTKVIEAVDFLASMGADINLSVMPLSDGFITLPDGTKKLIYSSVTGIDAEAAIKKSHEYNNVQLILVGISDEHIRLALEGEDVTFVIPFHGSGNTVHQIQVLMNLLGENLDVTTAQDYTAVQSDHVSPKQTKEQKAVWDLRVKILTGKASTLSAKEIDILNKNAFLKDLYERFYVNENAEEFGIALTSDVAGQIFPYEYWDKSLTYAEADKNGERFKEYCASMGIIPRFSGMNSKGENVGFGDFTNNKGYWKLLIDRPMYDNVYDADGNWIGYGNYHEQQRINCSNFQVKHLDPAYGSATYGDVMSKANDPKKTNMIVDRAIAQFENSDDRYSFRGVANDGKKIYESNFPKGTPKAAKSQRILNLIQNVWSKEPIKLVISNGETSRTILAQFDPTIDESQNTPTDASKIAGGNRHGNHTEQRVTLDLADDYYEIATDATYNYSKLETGKDSDTHKDVRMWHYFINEIYFAEYGEEEISPYTVTINVKEKDSGEFVYSFNAEKEFSTQRTLHAAVNTYKGANGELFLEDIITQPEEIVNRETEKFSDRDSLRDIEPIETSDYVEMYHHFGSTKNYDVAGYMLGNGVMLDFSGKHWGDDYSTSRQVDHRDIQEVLGNRGSNNGVNAMIDMIGNGNIRLMPEVGGINLAVMPNATQMSQLRGYINHFKGEVTIDIDEVGGDTIHSFNYTRGTSSAKILADIKAYFDEGIVPEQKGETDIRQFLYSDRSTPTSTRSLLAGALETTAQNDIERTKISEYKGKIALIEAEYARLEEIRAELKKLYFPKKGTHRDTARITALQFEANQIANRINIYDRQLLNLESTTALRNVLQREKAIARKKGAQEGKAALARQRERQAQAIRTIMDRNAESRKKAAEGRHETEMRHKIKKVVGDLKALLLNPTKEKHVPIGLQKPVAEALDIINMDTVGAEERIAKLKGDLMKAKTPEEIQEISRKIDRIQLQGENLAEKLTALKLAYAEIKNSDDPLVRDSHDESIENLIADTADKVGSTSIRDMSLEQLEAVYDMYKAILATVRNANKMFKAEKQETITANSEWAKREISAVGGHRNRVLKATKFLKKFGWNMLKPIYAMKLIGSDTLTRLYENVRKGEDTWAVDVNEAKVFFKETASKYHYNSWDFKKQYTFKDSAGHTFSLTLEQLMSLYAYSKREQADKHLELGGFVFDDAIEVVEKNKLGIPVTYEVNDANPYRLKKDALGEIISILDTDALKDVKGFVDEMQAYLSDVMGAKGNEVSLAMYDIKLFKEKHYFPLKSSKYFREFDPEKSGTPRIKNSGFSKKTTPGAGNPIILSNFMDVWANHVNDMSMYHAFVLPLEDFMRVYNYSSTAGGYDSVQQYIKNAYGAQANTYIETLMNDLNGGARSDPATDLIGKGMSLFKKAAVFASASVVIQQPSAIARALAYIDAKYFVDKPEATKHSETWAEVKKYAPVAIIKEMGYFDTNMGRSTVDWIKEEKTWRDKVDDIASKAPALADELAWCAIWKAVKREVADSTNLKVGSEEFLEMAGKRFTEVVTKTQVYDSVLSRSALMRSKDSGAKMITAFMAEPTTSLNMVVDAIIEGKRGNKKFAWKAVGAVASSIILNSILVSLVTAARDDDEDETYIEKYLESLTAELLDGFNPLTYIPIFKDIWSIAQGYDVERSDMSIWSDFIQSVDNLFSDNKSGFEKTEGVVGAVASFFGLPLKNLMRDARAMYNLASTLLSGTPTTWAGVGDAIGGAVKDTIPFYTKIKKLVGADKSKSDNLYDAIISGDQKHIDRVKAQYKDDKAIESAIKQGLRENDSRIKEAAQARLDGDIDEYKRIAKAIIAEGHFSQDTVVAAINAEMTAIKKGEATEEEVDTIEKVTSIYSASDVNAAFESGDSEMALEVIDELFNTKVENYLAEARRDAEKNGKRFNERTARQEAETKAKSSIRSSMTSYWKPLYKEAYKSGNTAEKERIERILKTSGLYGSASEVIKTCREWRTER